MAQTSEGAIKVSAKRAGLSVPAYRKKLAAGFKWCYGCKNWHPFSSFKKDSTRYDGLYPICPEYRNRKSRERYKCIPPDQRKPSGPPPIEERDGDKKQARRRINVLVRTGKLPHPNTVPCTDCGHVWKKGERRHEYDHFEGYGKGSHRKAESVCTTCHHKRENDRKAGK